MSVGKIVRRSQTAATKRRSFFGTTRLFVITSRRSGSRQSKYWKLSGLKLNWSKIAGAAVVLHSAREISISQLSLGGTISIFFLLNSSTTQLLNDRFRRSFFSSLPAGR